jgi:hypothetical protein
MRSGSAEEDEGGVRMKGDFYKMEYETWDEETYSISLELEAAYLRVCHQTYRRGGPISSDPRVLCGLWRCHPNKARKLLGDLLVSGKVHAQGDKLFVRTVRFDDVRQPLPLSIRAEVYARDGLKCTYCGTTEAPLEIDHVYPFSRGGPDTPENLCVSCRACNRSKGSKLIEEWL